MQNLKANNLLLSLFGKIEKCLLIKKKKKKDKNKLRGLDCCQLCFNETVHWMVNMSEAQ